MLYTLTLSVKLQVMNMLQANNSQHIFPSGWRDYSLIDSGYGQKLERFGSYCFVRPESQALWSPRLSNARWKSADGHFIKSGYDSEKGGSWRLKKTLPENWQMQFENIRFFATPTSFRHLGFFPEQSVHWQWCATKIKKFKEINHRAPKILNLFAYTGVASLHAANAGAEVTHIDASKKAIQLAFNNRAISKLDKAPIRFITDDVTQFVKREVRRGNFYDGIILDPPKYGRGPKGEIWQLHENLPHLLSDCSKIISGSPLFLVATVYAVRMSIISIHSAIANNFAAHGGKITSGEIAIMENCSVSDKPARALGQALYVRWSGF